MTPEHVFRLASHSKMFTATAIMQLVEQGKLRLDDRTAVYVSWLNSDVTLRQLLNHAGGVIRDGLEADFWRVEQPFPDVATSARARARRHDPAAQYEVQVQQRRFRRAWLCDRSGQRLCPITGTSPGSTSSTLCRIGQHRPGARGRRLERCVHGLHGQAARRATPRRPAIDTRALSPATGLISNAEDLCRFAAAHWLGDRTLLTDASKREMQHAAWTVEQSEERYGLGFIAERIGERETVGHSGGFPASRRARSSTRSTSWWWWSSATAAARMGAQGSLATQIVRFIEFAQCHPGRSNADLARYTGRFANVGGVLDIVALAMSCLDSRQSRTTRRSSRWEFEILDPDRLRITKCSGFGYAGESIRYERDAAGNTQRIITGGVTVYPE